MTSAPRRRVLKKLFFGSAAAAACGPPTDPVDPQESADPCEIPGAICTWMGLPELALVTNEGLHRTKSGLYLPQDVQFGPDGSAYVGDFNSHRVVEIDPDGIVHVVAGTGFPGDGPYDGASCDSGCDARLTQLWHPSQVIVDPRDPNLVLTAAWHDHRIVSTSLSDGKLYWTLGDGEPGYDTDPVSLSYPSSLAMEADGTYYVTDQANQIIRRVDADGTVTVLAGSPGVAGYEGDGGPATEALLYGHDDWVGGPTSKITLHGRALYLADTVNGVIRVIDLDTGVIDRVAGRYVEGTAIGSEQGYEGDGGDAVDAVLAIPRAVGFAPTGEMYIADSGNNCVRVVDPDGIIRPFAGRCGEEAGFAGDEGPALEATLAFPCGVTVGPDGAVYIADSNNQIIRRVAPGP